MVCLFDCFGSRRRKEKLLRRQRSREHAKTQNKFTPFGVTFGSGRASKNDYGASSNEPLLFPEATTEVRILKKEVRGSIGQSSGISLRYAVELPNLDSQNSFANSQASESVLDDLHTSQRQASETSVLSGTLTDEKTQDGEPGIQPSLGYGSFLWREPLSPIPEEEEEHDLTGSVHVESAEKGSGHLRQKSVKVESPVGVVEVESKVTPVKDELINEERDIDITPVRCPSPDIIGRARERRGKRSGQVVVGKENMFMGVVATETSGGGREKEASVLTPVENTTQWRHLKGDKSNKKTQSSEEDKVVVPLGEEVDIAFFKELALQQSSCEITPHLKVPSFGWHDQGVPNTNTKYREDQKVTWHSTPFEVRLDKALASSWPRYHPAGEDDS